MERFSMVLLSITTKDPMDYLTTTTIASYGAPEIRSLYRLFFVLSIVGLGIGLIIGWIQIGGRNPHKREEAKGKLIFRIILVFVLFQAVAGLAWLYTLGQGLLV